MENGTHRRSSSEMGNARYRYLFHTIDPRSLFDIDTESSADTRHMSHYLSTADPHRHEHLVETRKTTDTNSGLSFSRSFYHSDNLDRSIHFYTVFVLSARRNHNVVHSVNRRSHNLHHNSSPNNRAKTFRCKSF